MPLAKKACYRGLASQSTHCIIDALDGIRRSKHFEKKSL